MLFIPLSQGPPKENVSLVAALLGSGNSRALPTTSLGLQSPADKRAVEARSHSWTLPEPAQEATRACPNILGRRQRMQSKEHISVSLPMVNVLTQHPLGEEVHVLADKPCREPEPKVPRERRKMCQKHGVMAALKATPCAQACQGQP